VTSNRVRFNLGASWLELPRVMEAEIKRDETLASCAPAPHLNVGTVQQAEPAWIVAVDSGDRAACPDCGTSSSSRRSSYQRTLRDLDAQEAPVAMRAGSALALPE
jgi:hypothetical protein